MNTKRRSHLSLAAVSISMAAVASAQQIDLSLPTPTADRWMYPFNSTPGARPAMPLFGGIGSVFDNRSGQIVLGYDTSNEVPTGLGQLGYTIQSAQIKMMILGDQRFVYDPTLDGYETYLIEGGTPDLDPGRPIILSPVGFRDGYTGATFGDDGPYSTIGDANLRTAYPANIGPDGELIDISKNVANGFDPQPFAVGQYAKLMPGDPVPEGSIVVFDLDIANPSNHCYLANGLSDGYISLGVTSLHSASQPGGSVPASYPDIYASENIAVTLGLAQAASLEMVVTPHTDPPQPGDANRDGQVDLNDFSLLLVQFGGDCYCCGADFDQNGAVDIQDFSTLLVNFGCCQ